MPIYTYKDSPLIESVTIKKGLEAGYDATILLKENANQEDIKEILEQFGNRKLPAMKDSINGIPAIQVRGIKDEKTLFAATDKLNPANNATNREKIPEDEKTKESFTERMRKGSLLLPALFYDLGNIAFIISGIQRGRHNPGGKFTPNDFAEMGVGASFAFGDVLMTIYGKNSGAEELSAAAEGLRKYLKEKGINIPKEDRLNPDTLYKSGAFEAANNWMHKNIIYVRTLAESVGGLNMVASAIKPGHRNNQKLAAGLFLTTGWFATFLLEKPRGHKIFNVHDDPNLSLIDRIKDNPRGYLASSSSVANNFLNFAGALEERKKWKNDPAKRHDYIWNMYSTGAFLIGNILFGLSGKARPSETEADKRITQDLVLMAANTLASTPELGKVAIDEAAEYISTKLAHVQLSKEEAVKTISDKVAEITKGTWVSRTQPTSSSNSNITI